MGEDCDDSPNYIGDEDNGVEDVVDCTNNDIGDGEESTGSIPSLLFSRTRLSKRLRLKVWEDFIPTFVDGKVVQAECMHCHRVFNYNSTNGTTGLCNHQAKCSPGTQKRLKQQVGRPLPSTKKITPANSSDPNQKKLPFLLSRQNKCTGTADAVPVKELAFPDAHTNKNNKNQEVDQNDSHEVLAAPEFTMDQHMNLSHGEIALPEHDFPNDSSQKNQKVDQNCSPEELVRIFAIHGPLPRMMEQDEFRNQEKSKLKEKSAPGEREYSFQSGSGRRSKNIRLTMSRNCDVQGPSDNSITDYGNPCTFASNLPQGVSFKKVKRHFKADYCAHFSSNGYVELHYSNMESTIKSLRFNGSIWRKHLIRLDWCGNYPSRTILITGFDTSLKTKKIRRLLGYHFSPCGTIKHLSILTRRPSVSRNKVAVATGKAFMEFETFESLIKGILLDQSMMNGFKLEVQVARPKPVRQKTKPSQWQGERIVFESSDDHWEGKRIVFKDSDD